MTEGFEQIKRPTPVVADRAAHERSGWRKSKDSSGREASQAKLHGG